jgi:hypothetical protein
MNIAACKLCDDSEGKAFRVPWDAIGINLMTAHMQFEHHVTVNADNPPIRLRRKGPRFVDADGNE